MLDGDDPLAPLQGRILRQLHGVVGRPGRHAHVAQDPHDLLLGAALGKRAQETIHLTKGRFRVSILYLGLRGLKRLGKKRWRHHVTVVVGLLKAALEPDDVVIGGGNAKKLDELPPGCRLGDNANAFIGGFALWKDR